MPLLRLALGLLLAGLAPQPLAQTAGSILPDLTGEALQTALAETYSPSATLPLEEARDTLYVVDGTRTSDTWTTTGFYSGLDVTFDCPPPCDPSERAAAAGSLMPDPIWPRSLGTDSGLALGDLHNLVPAREAIQTARAGLLFGESADAETATWFADAVAQSQAPPAEARDEWTEVGSTVEPRESRKGEVARALFYVYAVYGPAGTGQVDTQAFEAMKETLLFWHESDPPTYADVGRSERVSAYQSTASGEDAINPFVHDPTLARRAYFVAPVLFVRPSAPAEAVRIATGTSWATALPGLDTALRLTADHAFVAEVWAASGTYTPGTDRGATFSLRSGLGLYGGFDGTEASPDDRAPDTAPTVLSGDIGTMGDPSDNVRTVVTAVGSEADRLVGLVVDRVTVSGGNGGSSISRRASGLDVQFADMTLTNAVFESNSGGWAAGAYFEASVVTVEASRFLNNDGYFTGGLMYYGTEGLVSNVSFVGNTSTNGSGGASVLYFSQATLRDLTFERNASGTSRIDGRGGGLFVSDSDVTLSRATFRHNTTRGPGGGLAVSQGSLSAANVLFYGNRAGEAGTFNHGGGLSVRGTDPFVLANSVFVANVAHYGGAIEIEAPRSITFSNIVAIANGSYERVGGAIQIGSDFNDFDLTLVNSIVVDNAEAEPAADGFTFVDGGTERTFSFWRLSTTPLNEEDIFLTASVLRGGCPSAGYPENIVTCDEVQDTAPLLTRAPSAGPDGVWATGDDDLGDLRLTLESPGVDAGRTAALPADVWDLDGDGDTAEALPVDVQDAARVLGDAVDLGAYEGPASVATGPDERPAGDRLTAAPNPFRGQTALTLEVSQSQPVTVAAFDVLGREVATLFRGDIGAGAPLTLTFDGRTLPTGVYLVRATGATLSLVRRITLAR